MANLTEAGSGVSQSAFLVPDTNQMISHSSVYAFYGGTDPTLTPVRSTSTPLLSTGAETISGSGLSTVLNTRAVVPAFGTGSLTSGNPLLYLLANQVSYVAWRGDYRRQYSAYWSFRITGERYGLFCNGFGGGDATVFHLTQPRADTYRNFRRGRNPFFFYCAGTINNHQKTGGGAYQLHIAHQNNDGLLWVDGRAWRLGNSQSDFFDILLFPPANVFPVDLTATLNFVGAFGPTRINKNLTATLSPTATLVKFMGKNFTATLSFVGVLTMGRMFVRAFVATLSFTGSLTTIRLFLRNFAANLSFTGLLTKLPQKQFTATLSPSGVLTKRMGRNFTATLSFVGVLGASKFFMRAFTATTNFTGALSKQVGKNFSANLWSAGAGIPVLLDSYSESHQDSFLSVGSGFAWGAGQTFSSGTGGTLDSCKFNITKVTAPTGNAIARLYALTGTFGSTALPTGSPLAESDPFDVSTLPTSPTYALITFNFTGANRYVMAPSTNYGIEVEYNGTGGRIQVGIDALAGLHAGNAFHLNSPGTTWSNQSAGDDFPFYIYIGGGWGSLTKRIVKAPFTATQSFVGALTKRIPKQFAATLSFVGSLATVKLFLRAFAATLVLSGNLSRRTNKSFAATLAFTTTFFKNVNKVFAATLSFAGAWAYQLNAGGTLFFQNFAANLVFAGVLTKRSTKSLTATLSFTGVLGIGRFFARAFTATLNFSGLLRRQTGKNFTATQTFSTTFTKRVGKQLSAILAPTAVLTKRINKSFTAVTSFIGVLTRSRVFARAFTATLVFSGNLKRVLGKNFLADLVFSGQLNKKTYKYFNATLSFIGTFTGNLISTWAYYINLIKGQFKPTQSQLDVTSAESTLGHTDADSGDFKNVKTNDDS